MPTHEINYINFKTSIVHAIKNFKQKHKDNKLSSQAILYIDNIENCLNTAKTGHDLWDMIRNEIVTMPSRWAFLSKEKIFTLMLEDLLERFKKEKLLLSDLQRSRQEYDLLMTEYSELEKKFFSLRKEWVALKDVDVIEINRNLKITNEILKEKLAALEINNANQKETIKYFEIEIEKLKQINQQLVAYNEKLGAMYEDLSKRYDEFQSDVSIQIKSFRHSQEIQEDKIKQLEQQREYSQQNSSYSGGVQRYFKSSAFSSNGSYDNETRAHKI